MLFGAGIGLYTSISSKYAGWLIAAMLGVGAMTLIMWLRRDRQIRDERESINRLGREGTMHRARAYVDRLNAAERERTGERVP